MITGNIHKVLLQNPIRTVIQIEVMEKNNIIRRHRENSVLEIKLCVIHRKEMKPNPMPPRPRHAEAVSGVADKYSSR